MWKWMFTKVIKMREKVAGDLGQGDVEKPFIEHLEDLRTMIVRMALTLTIFACSAFAFYSRLMEIIFYPLDLAGIRDKVTLIEPQPIGIFMATMNVSIAIGAIVACPLLLYFLLQFILPGLRTTEKKVIFPALSVGVGLFMCGACFAYFIVAPRALTFFYEFGSDLTSKPAAVVPAQDIKLELSGGTLTITEESGAKKELQLTGGTLTGSQSIIVKPLVTVKAPPIFIWSIGFYVKFICQFVLIFGLCFELPVVVMALVKLDVLSYKVMRGSRTYAVITIAVVSAILAPSPDVFTLGLIALPLYALYEICIWLAWWMDKKDRAANPDYYKGLDEDEKALNEPSEWDNENYNPWNEDSRDDDEDLKPKRLGDTPAPAHGIVPHEVPPPDASNETPVPEATHVEGEKPEEEPPHKNLD